MRSCRQNLFSLGLASFALLSGVSCSNPPDPAGVVDQHKANENFEAKQSPIVPPTLLGNGVKWGNEGWEPTQNSCLPEHDTRVAMDWKSLYSAGVIRESHQIEHKIGVNLGGDLNLLGMLPISELEFTYEKSKSKDQDTQFFYVLAQVQTASRWIDLDYPSSGASVICEMARKGDQLGDDKFIKACGAQYVSAERLGGAAMLWVDISHLSEQEKQALSAAFETDISFGEITSGSPNAGGSFDILQDLNIHQLQFRVATVGLPNPNLGKTPDQDGWVTASVDEWVTYINGIHSAVHSATSGSNPNPYDGALGVVIGREVQAYSESIILNSCDYDLDLTELICVEDFHQSIAELYNPFDSIWAAAESIEWRLENPDWVAWPETPGVNVQDEYDSAMSHIQSCLGKIGVTYNECSNYTHEDDPMRESSYCEVCEIPHGCSYKELSDMLMSLPEADPIAPDVFYPSFHYVKVPNNNVQLAAAGANVCFLTGVAGKLQNDENGVYLRRVSEGGLSFWKAEVFSDTIKESEQIRGRYACVPRNAFVLAQGRSFHVNDEKEYELHSSGGNVSESILHDSGFLALSGIQGKMVGGGEWAHIIWFYDEYLEIYQWVAWLQTMQGPDHDIYSLQRLHDFFPPSNEPVQLWPQSEGANRFHVEIYGGQQARRLAPVTEAMCFLTRVKGHFDGAGEQVRLRVADDYWQIEVKAGGNKHIGGTAMCVKYDQS